MKDMARRRTMSQNIIELRNIKKVFEDDDTTVVENFNLEVKKGEFVTFLGPSGCGKTTTLRMIAGFEFPTEGEILLNGEDPESITCPLRRHGRLTGPGTGRANASGKHC